ncbi:MAG: glycosyltransferase family 39 protein [Gemmatimonadota bacterium]|jgi:hypothetical protein
MARSDTASIPRPEHAGAFRIALFLAGLSFGAHMLGIAISAYEFHRDEFLYLAMGDHLRLWGMDFPPFIAIIANLERFLFGDHLWAIRLFPAIAGALLVAVAVDTAARMGGGRLAQVAAGLSILSAPLFLRAGALFQPVVFDQLWWTLALWTLLRRGLDDEPRWWLGTGAALGIGLLTKFSIAFIAIPLAVASLATALRRDFATRWPWLALGLALLIGHPSVAGQFSLGWPFFTQMADLRAAQLERVTWGAFLGEQLLMMGPAALLALAGAVRLVARPRGAVERSAGLAAVGAFLFLLLLHGKAYYAGPVYPVLVAAGAAWLGSRERVRRAPGRTLGVIVAMQAAFGIVTLPMGLPVLPPAPMAAYAARLGVAEATRTNRGVQLDLPQDYADMLGWSAFADTVARVFNGLPDAERRTASLLATNYGRAGALDWYGRRLGLPPAVAPVGSYWFWGPGERTWDVAVIAGSDSVDLAGYFRQVRRAARMVDERRVPEERDVTVWVVRDPIEPMAEVWPRFEGQN